MDGKGNEEAARSFVSNEHSEICSVELPGTKFCAGKVSLYARNNIAPDYKYAHGEKNVSVFTFKTLLSVCDGRKNSVLSFSCLTHLILKNTFWF